MTGDQDYARLTTFRVLAVLFVGTWILWGIEIVRGRPTGPGAAAALVSGIVFFVVIRWSAAARATYRRTDRWSAAHAWVDALRWAAWIGWVGYLGFALVAAGDGINWTAMLWLTAVSLTLAVVEPLVRRRAARPGIADGGSRRDQAGSTPR